MIFMRLYRQLLCVLMMLMCVAAHAEDNSAVREATASIYRLWLGMPLPREFALRAGTSYLPELENKGYAIVSLDGLYLQNRAAAKAAQQAIASMPMQAINTRALGGKGVIFQYAEQKYLLLNTGSAWAISDKGYLLTNARFVMNTGASEVLFAEPSGMRHFGENGGKDNVFVVKGIFPKLSLLPAQPLVTDITTDLAVVQASSLKAKPIAFADGQFAETATPVFAVGMEGVADQLAAKRGGGEIEGANYLLPLTEEGLLQRRVRRNSVGLWEHTALFAGSMSGGALLNQCGQAVGVMQAAFKNDGKIFAAIDIAEAAHLLKKHNVPFKQEQGRCGGVAATAANVADKVSNVAVTAVNKPQQWLPLAIMTVLGLLVCGIVWKTLQWVWRKKKHQAEYISQNSNPKGSNLTAHTVRMTSNATINNVAILRCVAGGWQDIQLAPNSVAVIVGRREEANISILNGQVSAKHVQLWFDGVRVYAEDLNSTNGTYLNGKRMTDPCIISAGDTLQLTADTNVAAFQLISHTEVTQKMNATTSVSNLVLQPLSIDMAGIPLRKGQILNIGRASGNDLVLSDPQISGQHCRISVNSDGSVHVEDLASSNGTFIDNLNKRVNNIVLKIGQTLYLANEENAFRLIQKSKIN